MIVILIFDYNVSVVLLHSNHDADDNNQMTDDCEGTNCTGFHDTLDKILNLSG